MLDLIERSAAGRRGPIPSAEDTTVRSSRRGALTFLAMGVGLIILVVRLISLAHKTYDFANPIFGTAGAPYSDALGPWVWGALCHLLRMPVPDTLYRPSIGVFWGSIIAFTGRIDVIPWFFAAWFTGSVAALGWFLRDSPLGLAVAGWLLATNLAFVDQWATISPVSEAADFPVLVIGIVGVLSAMQEFRRPGVRLIPLAAASCLIGVAAAIRGPLLLGGPAILGVGVMTRATGRRHALVVAVLAFLMPVVADVAMQRAYGTVNNGVASLYCAYTDPAETWTPDCHLKYLSERPTAKHVVTTYVQRTLSWDGLHKLVVKAATRLDGDMAPFRTVSFYLLAAAILVIGRAIHSKGGRRRSPWPAVAFGAIVVLGGAEHAALPADRWHWSILTVLALMVVSAVSRRWIVMGLLLGYMLCYLFLALMGLAAYTRLSATFGFLFPLAVSVLLLPTSYHDARSPELPTSLSLVHVAILAALYSGVIWWPSSLRSTFATKVDGQPTAVKLSEDRRIDRALYLTGTRMLVYVRADDEPIGAVRRYGSMRYGDRYWNRSFLEPNEFMP